MSDAAESARNDALWSALTEVLTSHADHASDRGRLTSWLVITEHIGDDGDRYLNVLSPDDSTSWHRLGMAEFAAQVERNAIRPGS